MQYSVPASDEFLPPPLRMLARESLSFAFMRFAAAFGPAAAAGSSGLGQSVMVIPGFMASDHTTARLRRSLDSAGYRSHGWGLGRNRVITPDIFDQINAQVDRISPEKPIMIIGWSLGGLIAREFAKQSPHRVTKVVTLGSPFSGGPRANNAWRVYELIAGHRVDSPPIRAILNEKPPVPTIAFWSAQDGVVAARSACGLPGESDRQIELDCTHMAYVARPNAIAAIAAALAD